MNPEMWAPQPANTDVEDARATMDELTRLHRHTVGIGAPAVSPACETERIVREMGGGRGILLPDARQTGVSLEKVLQRRRTCRTFRSEDLTVEQLGSVLSLAARAGGGEPPAPKIQGGPPAQRPYPSGGALYPVEIIIYAAHVRGVARGFYYYQALAHRLVPWAPAPDEGVHDLLAAHPIENAAFLVLLFLDLSRPSLARYGGKAYRLALLEAGHLAQNILLGLAAFDLSALPSCGFDDEALGRAAHLQCPEQPVVYVLAAGTAAEELDG